MKLFLPKILIIILYFLSSCSDRSLFTDPNDPGLGGFYTILSGEITGNLVTSKSPYYVTNNISIRSGSTISIEAGTIIFFKAGTGLNINGGIRAIGNKDFPIVFKGVRDEWNGIHSTNPTDSLIFIFCRIQDIYLPLSSDFRYGGIEISNANLIINNCYFYYNYAQYGGALSLLYCNSEITNNIFQENESLDYGGAILSQNSSNKIINNTFYKNFCLNFGGAITVVDPVYEEIQNNIFFDNFSYRGDARIHFVSGDSTNIFQQYNFLDPDSLSPLFISSTDFHLQENSPCKNAGNPSPEFNDVDGSRNDQGAYGGPEGDW
ncbi:MAG: right-handed parallel beta-helix repeat-containing protein [Ignavibacteriaceae bacterium]|nr:right-handed parallel beta-helix repeat-containing protein [Ignavibacteriaceae bacterium]